MRRVLVLVLVGLVFFLLSFWLARMLFPLVFTKL